MKNNSLKCPKCGSKQIKCYDEPVEAYARRKKEGEPAHKSRKSPEIKYLCWDCKYEW